LARRGRQLSHLAEAEVLTVVVRAETHAARDALRLVGTRPHLACVTDTQKVGDAGDAARQFPELSRRRPAHNRGQADLASCGHGAHDGVRTARAEWVLNIPDVPRPHVILRGLARERIKQPSACLAAVVPQGRCAAVRAEDGPSLIHFVTTVNAAKAFRTCCHGRMLPGPVPGRGREPSLSLRPHANTQCFRAHRWRLATDPHTPHPDPARPERRVLDTQPGGRVIRARHRGPPRIGTLRPGCASRWNAPRNGRACLAPGGGDRRRNIHDQPDLAVPCGSGRRPRPGGADGHASGRGGTGPLGASPDTD
jgi:hypothetical protein